jgi:hypothetical protein
MQWHTEQSDAQQSDAQPSDAQRSDAQQSDAQQSDAQQSHSKQSDAQQSDAKSPEEKQAAAKPPETQPSNGKQSKDEPPPAQLPPLPKHDENYETPRAGTGFFTRVFGRRVVVWPQDRQSVTAWDLGAAYTAGAKESEWTPIGAIFLWRRPNEDVFLRGVISGFFNDIEYAYSPKGWGSFELVTTLNNLIFPAAKPEYVDGNPDHAQELTWGRMHFGVGLGYRTSVYPGKADNMFATSLLFEPGYLFSDASSDTAPNFVQPVNTFEERLHWRVRYDALERNLLELAHRGYALGMDAIAGHRNSWKDWGLDAEQSGADGRDYLSWTGYVRAATGVPGLNEQHRLVFGVHGGVGSDLDRFSAQRVGGGPEADEYGSVPYPVIPAALPTEFFPAHYAIATLEYRFEPIFFVYLGIEGSIAYLDLDHRTSSGIEREDDVLKSIGARMTTGFVFETRLEVEGHYNFDLVRDGHLGGYAITFHISRNF